MNSSLDLSNEEKEKITKIIIPDFESENVDSETVFAMMDVVNSYSNAMTSYVFIEIHEMLLRRNQQKKENIEIYLSEEGLSSAFDFGKKNSDKKWRFEYQYSKDGDLEPDIVLSKITNDGMIELAQGRIGFDTEKNGKKYSKMRAISKAGAFTDVCELSAEFSDEFLIGCEVNSTRDTTFYMDETISFAGNYELLTLDNWIPGAACAYTENKVAEQFAKAICHWAGQNYKELEDKLSELGANWGEALFSHNDGDYQCCNVNINGKSGFFSNNSAGGFSESGYVALFETKDNNPVALSLYMMDDKTSFESQVASIGEGNKIADFVFDYDSMEAHFGAGQKGRRVLNLFALQLTSDLECSPEDGEVISATEFSEQIGFNDGTFGM